MELAAVGLFDPTFSALRKLEQWHAIPIIQISPSDSISKKSIGFVLNGLKKRVVEVAAAAAFVFLVLYSLIAYPFRWLSQNQAAERLEAALDAELSRFDPREIVDRETMVQQYFEKHKAVFSMMTPESKGRIARRIVAQCALTEKVLAPVARGWVDHLLEKANREEKKLIFIARDGTPYYKIALKLMELPEYKAKYPNLAKKGAISLAYLSRNLVAASQKNRELFRRYIFEEMGVEPKDRCLFADVGFQGTIIGDVRSLLPEVQCEFNYLIATSLTPEEGYLGSPKDPLSNFLTAHGVLASRWLEEPHHGTVASPKRLVVGQDGRIYPDTLYPKKVRFDQKFSEHYLYRKFCSKRCVDAAVDFGSLNRAEWAKARERFNQVAGAINKGEIPLFVNHWDR